MPVKAIFVGVALAAAVGYAVYEQRDELRDFADRSRARIAMLLRRIADEISDERRRHAEEVPMAGRSFTPASSSDNFSAPPSPPNDTTRRRHSNPFTDQNARRHSNPFSDDHTTAVTGCDSNAIPLGQLRRRGGEPQDASTSVLFESDGHHDDNKVKEVPAAVIPATASFPVVVEAASPIPEFVVPTPQSLPAAVAAPLESVYETAATASQAGNPTPSQSSTTVSDSDYETAETVEAAVAPSNPFANSQQFWSIHEWQENTVHADANDVPSSPSLAGSAAEDDLASISDLASDFGSEHGSIASWTEVASEFSDDHMV